MIFISGYRPVLSTPHSTSLDIPTEGSSQGLNRTYPGVEYGKIYSWASEINRQKRIKTSLQASWDVLVTQEMRSSSHLNCSSNWRSRSYSYEPGSDFKLGLVKVHLAPISDILEHRLHYNQLDSYLSEFRTIFIDSKSFASFGFTCSSYIINFYTHSCLIQNNVRPPLLPFNPQLLPLTPQKKKRLMLSRVGHPLVRTPEVPKSLNSEQGKTSYQALVFQLALCLKSLIIDRLMSNLYFPVITFY
jgi:hypothetical protein